MKRKLILVDLLQKSLRGEKPNSEEQEIITQGHKDLYDSGLSMKAGILKDPIAIPFRINNPEYSYRQLRGLDSQAYLLPSGEDILLRSPADISIFRAAGAQYFESSQSRKSTHCVLSGDVHVSWADDFEDPDSDGETLNTSGPEFSPKRAFALVDIPISLISQGGPFVEIYIRDKISQGISWKIDTTIGGVLSKNNYRPQGMGYSTTTASVSIEPTTEDILKLEEIVGTLRSSIDGFAYLTNAKGRKILKKLYVGNGDNIPLWKENKVNDYRAFASNAISAAAGAGGDGNLLIFGDFADLMIMGFGAYLIDVDVYTLKHKGMVQLSINSYWDVKSLRGGTESDDYAKSFGVMAVK